MGQDGNGEPQGASSVELQDSGAKGHEGFLQNVKGWKARQSVAGSKFLGRPKAAIRLRRKPTLSWKSEIKEC